MCLSLAFSVICGYFLFPQFMLSPDRTFFDVSNFKFLDFDFLFVARSSNFSHQGRSFFHFRIDFIFPHTCVRTQFWHSSLTTNWSQHNCAFLIFPNSSFIFRLKFIALIMNDSFRNCNPPQLNAMVPNLRFNFHGKKGFGKEFSILIHPLFLQSVVHSLFHLLSHQLLHPLLL